MSLKAPTIPAVVKRAFTDGLGNYLDPRSPLWSLLLKQYVALPWYSLRLSEIGKLGRPQFKKPIDELEDLVISTGWRFMAADGNCYGGCHVGSVTARDNPPILTGFSDDPQILTFMEALEQLKTLSVAGTGQFELRVLRVAWLHFDAFWLSTPDGAGDIVVPFTGFIEGSPNHLSLMHPYPVLSFLKAIWGRVLLVGARENERQARKHTAEAHAAEAQVQAQKASAKALAEKAAQRKKNAEELLQKATQQKTAYKAFTTKPPAKRVKPTGPKSARGSEP
jgi:hypothetical protein